RQAVTCENPQIFALGVKEIWETRRSLDTIVHTLGWPVPTDAFGGSFMYPLEPNLVALGLVVGLDYRDAALDVHALLQRMKLHPLFRQYLEGGEMVEWGAKTIPEGGYYAVPARRSGDGVVILGDAAGFVDVPSLKGIHYAMQSGMFAARAIHAGLTAGDTSGARLAEYDRLVNASFIMKDLYRTRNMRLAFKDGFYAGGVKAALMTLTGGRFPGGKPAVDAPGRRERAQVQAHVGTRCNTPPFGIAAPVFDGRPQFAARDRCAPRRSFGLDRQCHQYDSLPRLTDRTWHRVCIAPGRSPVNARFDLRD